MATYNKFDQFVEDMARKVHNLNADTLKIVLSNTAPSAGLKILSEITQITAANGYVAGGNQVGSNGATQTGGILKLVGNDVTFTASGGSIGPFQYVILYNDTPTSPADPLIGWWDRGAALTILNGESFVVDLDQANGILTVQ